MTEQDNREKYAYLDRLSTERLEELIRADIDCPDDTNDEVIFHILEIMKKREREHPTGRLVDVDEAWAEFQQYYNTPEGEGQSLYPTGDKKETPCGGGNEIVTVSQRQGPGIVRPRRWLKSSLIAAAAIAALMVGMVGVRAAGIDVLGAIGRWREKTFHFAPSSGV